MQKKQSVLLFFNIIVVLFLTNCNSSPKLCDGEKIDLSMYDTIYPNQDGDNKCDYIILKKKSEANIFNFLNLQKEELRRTESITKEIEVADAIRFVKNYNEKYNTSLTGSSFVDMDRTELILYLIDVAAWLKKNPVDKSNTVRIYLGDRSGSTDSSAVTSIITVKSDKGEVYLEKSELKPLDWGSLCPPPASCITEKKADLLEQAIKLSNASTNKPAGSKGPIKDPRQNKKQNP